MFPALPSPLTVEIDVTRGLGAGRDGQGGVDLVTPAWAERMLRFPDAVGESAFDILLVGIRDGDFVHRAVGDGEGERISGFNLGEGVLSRQVE